MRGKQRELTEANGPRTHAVMVNRRFAVTCKLRKMWIGLM